MPEPIPFKTTDLAAAVKELRGQRDALINAAIVETVAVFVWHLGSKGGHEPTRALVRAAVMRAAGIGDVDLRGTIIKYDDPMEPATDPEDWEANREEQP